MTVHLNRVGHNVPDAPGTGDLVLGSVPDGFLSALAAGAVDGGVYEFVVETADGLVFETFLGTYRTAGPSIERTTVRITSNGGTGNLNLPASCVVYSNISSESVDTDTSASAAAAAASAAAALASESAASTSETNAGNSETAAAASAAAALASEGAASTSETNAAASETAAGLSEIAAAVSEGVAAAAAIAAAASESAAASSASAASTSEGNAATSETNSAASALAASNSETAAGISETAAAASAAAAAASAASVDVNKVGTPADNQVAVWTGDGTIEGASALTYDGTKLATTSAVQFGSATLGFFWDATNNRLALGEEEHGMTIGGAGIPTLFAAHSDAGESAMVMHGHATGSDILDGAVIYGARSDGTAAAPTIVVDADFLAVYAALGYDGTDYEQAARIDMRVDGTPGAGDMPGRINFLTSPDGSAAPVLNMSIRQDGTVAVTSAVLTLNGIAALDASDIGASIQAYDVDTLKADTADVLTAGFAAADEDAGTKSSGTFTPNEALGNMQRAVNGGAHTFAPPTNNSTLVIQYTNNASAGAITTSGFTLVDGDSLTTVNGDDFMFYVTKFNGFSALTVKALQ